MYLFQYRACEENHRKTFISWLSRRNHAYMYSIGVSVETKHQFILHYKLKFESPFWLISMYQINVKLLHLIKQSVEKKRCTGLKKYYIIWFCMKCVRYINRVMAYIMKSRNRISFNVMTTIDNLSVKCTFTKTI